MKFNDCEHLTHLKVRAARMLLEWTQMDLSTKSKVPVIQVSNFECGKNILKGFKNALYFTLKQEGIVFLPYGVEKREAKESII